MATENRPVSCYLPKDIEDSLTKYCTQNNITRKDKAGNIQPAMGTAIVEILESFFGDNPSKLPNFEEKIDAAIEAKMNAAIASLRAELVGEMASTKNRSLGNV
ncbi:hypothetical protein EZJ55_00400 [Microcystis aeruginosa EAWAG127a]|uniref:Uncharacterized protein n=1 Tax=Microcystis aeruginosa EAWAG127a TaxID=2529855 RepID=A0A5J5M0T2_MICAE|nr:hypothetical protein [Microcystis aeruginosa]KAB0243979.1 hypothetical protein EZJ55_00050 [Microcystis aeruginosa EAWAG127a]KAB0244038.1 hypothetical protein EZJ55_00400 [Microcystis aeruginosa EAWAG127a]